MTVLRTYHQGNSSQVATAPSPPATTVMEFDSAMVNFLKKAADGGLAEAEAGKMAQDKATMPDVKSFASRMVNDHSGALVGMSFVFEKWLKAPLS